MATLIFAALLGALTAMITLPLEGNETDEPPPPKHPRIVSGLDPDNSPNGDQPAWQLSGLFEGDIMLSDMKSSDVNAHGRWPTTTVPYFISYNFTSEQRDAILDALEDFRRFTCINLRPWQKGDVSYIYISAGRNGCHSEQGYTASGQLLNLDPRRCLLKGTVIHEVLHALGFYHQHSATNRDKYITIHKENILPGKERDFESFNNSITSDFGVEYDYESVMHYSEYAFTANGKKTIEPTMPNVTIGQRLGFSKGDIMKVNLLYNCQTDNAEDITTTLWSYNK